MVGRSECSEAEKIGRKEVTATALRVAAAVLVQLDLNMGGWRTCAEAAGPTSQVIRIRLAEE